MTESPNAELTTWDWVSLGDAELRRFGADPKDRIHYTGHRTHLLRPYLPTIGNWGLGRTKDFINTKEPHLGLVRVKPGAFRQFRHSRGLMTRSEFELHHGSLDDRPWLQAELAWRAHDRVQGLTYAANNAYCSVGVAADAIVKQGLDRIAEPRDRLGMLPVEIVLWARLFEVLRLAYGFAYDEWEALNDTAKAKYWDTGIVNDNGDVRVPFELERIAHQPAQRELRSYRNGTAAS